MFPEWVFCIFSMSKIRIRPAYLLSTMRGSFLFRISRKRNMEPLRISERDKEVASFFNAIRNQILQYQRNLEDLRDRPSDQWVRTAQGANRGGGGQSNKRHYEMYGKFNAPIREDRRHKGASPGNLLGPCDHMPRVVWDMGGNDREIPTLRDSPVC